MSVPVGASEALLVLPSSCVLSIQNQEQGLKALFKFSVKVSASVPSSDQLHDLPITDDHDTTIDDLIRVEVHLDDSNI